MAKRTTVNRRKWAKLGRSITELQMQLQTNWSREIVSHLAFEVLKRAQKKAPVRTGKLRDSGEVRVRQVGGGIWEATISFTAPYAYSVEHGRPGKGREVKPKTKAVMVFHVSKTKTPGNWEGYPKKNKFGYIQLDSYKMPSLEAQPFLEPAIRSVEKEATRLALRILATNLKKHGRTWGT